MAIAREKVIQTAERYVSRGKIQAAIKEYRKVLKANPRDANTLNRVGDLYARIDRIDEAVVLFTRIAEQYSDEGFLLKAIAIYKKIIKLDPTRLPVYEKLAELYHRQGLVNEARSQYQVLADYYDKHNDAESALAIFQRMVDLEPDNPSHRAKLADLSQRLGRVEDAIGQYKAVAEQMLSEGRLEEASRVYERALDVESEDIGFIADAVLKLKEAGQIEAAQRLLGMAVERNPRAEQVARLLGQGDAGEVLQEPEAEIFLELDGSGLPEPPSVAPTLETAPPAVVPEPEPTKSPTMELDQGLIEEAAHSSLDATGSGMGAAPAAEPATVGDGLAESGPTDSEPAELPTVDLDFDLDEEVFTFDLEDDSTPASLVQPPADMVSEAAETAPAISETGEFELDLGELAPVSEASDLGDLAPELPAADPLSEPPPSLLLDPEPVEVDAEALAGVADEVAPVREPRVDELVAEAEVLTKYGLLKKAQERLQQVFQEDPAHLGGLSVLLSVQLELGQPEAILETANKMADVTADVGESPQWEQALGNLERAGYALLDGQVVPESEASVPSADMASATSAPPAVTTTDTAPPDATLIDAAPVDTEPVAPEPVDAALVDTELAEPASADPTPVDSAPVDSAPVDPAPVDTAPPPTKPKKERRARVRPSRDLNQVVDDLAASMLDAPTAPRPTPTAPTVPAEAPAEELVTSETPIEEAPPSEEMVVEEVAEAVEVEATPQVEPPTAESGPEVIPEVATEEEAVAPEPEAAEPVAAEPEAEVTAPAGEGIDLDESMSWLDAAPESDATPEEELFSDEQEFFDLAAELEQELSAEGSLDDDNLLAQPQEQTLEEIVEGFKRGVAENLSAEDYETHFNLGIAYREMGLLDEAIGEFQLAAKGDGRLVECASMLGLCFLDKGLPELAIKWYGRGLEAPELSEEETLGLMYDLGNAYLTFGAREAAYETFVEIYGINTHYRDVVAKIEELAPS